MADLKVTFVDNASRQYDSSAQAINLNTGDALLFLGDRDAASMLQLKHRGITDVVNCQKDQWGLAKEKDVEYLCVDPEEEGDGGGKDTFEEAYAWIENVLEKKKRSILVHCQTGNGKAAAVVIYYVMRKQGVSLADAHRSVKHARTRIMPRPDLIRLLIEMEQVLRGTRPSLRLEGRAIEYIDLDQDEEEEQAHHHLLINLWCGPRTLSTATMYAFAQRGAECHVVDEPLYASYLAQNPSIYRPYRDELLASQDSDGDAVMQRLMSVSAGNDEAKIVVAKQIAKQTAGLNIDALIGLDGGGCDKRKVRHVFLFRDPLDMILCWDNKHAVHQEDCSLEATAFPQMVSFFSKLSQMARKGLIAPPIAVDSELLKTHPREVLTELCKMLNIPFKEEMLSWPAGPKPQIDGIWAAHWYDSVHRSTGFGEFESPAAAAATSVGYPTLSEEQKEVYREALPFYMLLRRQAIGVDPLDPGSCTTAFISSQSQGGEGAATAGGREKMALDLGISMRAASLADARNANVLVWIGSKLFPREQAKVSAFDSSVQGGDACWEGLRVYNGRVFMLEEHLSRLFDSAKALAFTNLPTRSFVRQAVLKTFAANGMRNDVHARVTLSRGAKITSSMNPAFNVFGCCLIILPEFKPVGDAATYDNQKGITLVTASGRRNGPSCLDSKIHHNNLLNNILPKIQANHAGAADSLMLDCEGFVSETNATNVFIVKNGLVLTPHADYCLPGITRSLVMDLVTEHGVGLSKPPHVIEKRISLTEFYAADESFTTGTMGEITPVTNIDGRVIGEQGRVGPITLQLQSLYRSLTGRLEISVPIPFLDKA